MAAVVLGHRYRQPSRLGSADAGGAPVLVLETSSPGEDPHPTFFSGFARRPDLVAAGLLAVARVARTRYSTPANMVAARIRAADPVVTCDGERLRFDSLSVCCGVHARLDVLPDGLDASLSASGTTNVDVNPPLRALAKVGGGEPLHLGVGPDELRVATLDARIVEKQVPLPERWLRSFAEVQLASSALLPRVRDLTVEPVDRRAADVLIARDPPWLPRTGQALLANQWGFNWGLARELVRRGVVPQPD